MRESEGRKKEWVEGETVKTSCKSGAAAHPNNLPLTFSSEERSTGILGQDDKGVLNLQLIT